MILLFYHLQQKILIVYLLGHIWIGFSIAFFLSSHLLKDEFSVIFIVGIKENRPWQVNTIAVCSSSTVLPTRGGGVLVFLCLPEISKYICFTTRIPSIQIQSNNEIWLTESDFKFQNYWEIVSLCFRLWCSLHQKLPLI